MTLGEEALARLAHERAVWITVDSTAGSVPRDAGTWMAVFSDSTLGTIGGGHVEYQAIAQARSRLAGASGEAVKRYALGPSLGQCCGGVMHLRFEPVDARAVSGLRQRLAAALVPVALFGGGHVGRALIDVLGRLPFTVRWIDSRDEIFPVQLPGTVTVEHSDPVHAAVAELLPQSRVLIMSFSHAEDLDVVAACLTRQRAAHDLAYIGLIGSKTKWATFRHRLEARGFTEQDLAEVTSPIGVAGVVGKEPEVIAVAVAAQLLQGRI
ncbi:MAG: xanthine dehydrogenase accessory protein XdhC [Burkholderiaceae bacterium]